MLWRITIYVDGENHREKYFKVDALGIQQSPPFVVFFRRTCTECDLWVIWMYLDPEGERSYFTMHR